MKCKYCDFNKSFGNESLHVSEQYDLFIVRDKIKILNDNNKSSEDVNIRYCPMCGMELWI